MAKKKKAEKPPRIMTRRQQSLHQRQQRRQRIIFIGGIAVIAAIVIIVFLGWFLGEYRPMNNAVIKVGDTDFDAGYVIDYMKIFLLNNPDQNVGMLVSTSVSDISRAELIRRAAETIDIVVTDEDARALLDDLNLPETEASLDIAEVQLLVDRLRNEYIDPMVPVTDNQVYMMATLVESEAVANDVRNQLENSGNFTALAEEYGQDKFSKDINSGDFGWHPRSILEDQVSTAVPLDFAFTAEVGTLSQPLKDEEITKQLGYWLINVLERPEENQANVNAILFSSRELAEEIRPRLEAGDNITAIAEEYNQSSFVRLRKGELGLLTRESNEDGSWKENVSAVFDAYAFSDNVVGEWSEPIVDDQLWTVGGYWLVKVVDRENNREITDEDRDKLIEKAFGAWMEGLQTLAAAEIDTSGLTDEIRQRIIDEVSKVQGQTGG